DQGTSAHVNATTTKCPSQPPPEKTSSVAGSDLFPPPHIDPNYSSLGLPHVYAAPPAGCDSDIVQLPPPGELGRAHVPLRHERISQRAGFQLQRYPTAGPGAAMQQIVQKLKGVKKFKNPSLNFVTDYELFDAGRQHFVRYVGLVNTNMLPFVWSSSSSRVVDSAGNCTAGRRTDKSNLKAAAGSSGEETTTWINIYAPEIAHRINSEAPGANPTNADIVNLMSSCAFDTVAHEAPSPWCNLFTSSEWESYEYYKDLSDYYGNGYGQSRARSRVGYINGVIARLTGQPVQDETQTNHTLDSSPLTFLLDKTFYADLREKTKCRRARWIIPEYDRAYILTAKVLALEFAAGNLSKSVGLGISPLGSDACMHFPQQSQREGFTSSSKC
ncbi:phosphoglycerate mutase-like protein, partial [Paxillus ammoniavirescens]